MIEALDHWWKAETEQELADLTVGRAHDIDEATIDRQQMILSSTCLYGDTNAWAYRSGAVRFSRILLSHNVLANAVDSLIADLTVSQPRPLFMPTGGAYDDEQAADKLTSYMDVKLKDGNLGFLGPQALRDGILDGVGLLRPYIERDEVLIERVHTLNILVDDRACIDVDPREIMLRRAVDRSHLKELYQDKRAEIEDAEEPQHSYWFVDSEAAAQADLVEVIEAWHLPSPGPDGEPVGGRHVIAVSNCVLVDEPWERYHFPLAFCRPIAPRRGFWGEPLAQRVRPAQAELNKLLQRIQRGAHILAKCWVWVQQGSKVNYRQMSNDQVAINTYSGTPPLFQTPPIMPAEMYKHRDWLVGAIYEGLGVSRMSAESMKPSGVISGKAVRMVREIGSRRQVNPARAYEAMVMDLAREVLVLDRQLAEEDPSHEVTYEEYGAQHRVPFLSIDMDEDAYTMQVFPVSAMPTTPVAKLEFLQELLESQAIDQTTFLENAEIPNTDHVVKMATAQRDDLNRMFSGMLRGDAYSPPEPFMDIAMGTKLAATWHAFGRVRGVSETRLELVRKWIVDANAMLKRAEEQLAAAAPPPPMGPPGMPPMPPDMMPPGPPMPGGGPPGPGLPPPVPGPGGPLPGTF